MARKRLLLAFGGRSVEHEISVRSATEVAAAVDREKFELLLLGIRRDGGFLTLAGASPSEVMAKGTELRDLRELNPDVVFPLLHGPYGEDGCFQGYLETLNFPYAGSGVLASALCMSKSMLKRLVAAEAPETPLVPFLKYVSRTGRGTPGALDFPEVVAEVEQGFGYPCFVKPDRLGSSLGTSRAVDRKSLVEGLRAAIALDDAVLIERAIDAREIELAVLGTGGGDTLVSAPGEIVLPPGTWYDFDTKYVNDVASVAIPADLDPELTQRFKTLALSAFRIAGCYGLARVDFLYDRKTETPYLNEINTLPGFTNISMYPKMMAHAGVSYSELITRLCELGIQRAERVTRAC